MVCPVSFQVKVNFKKVHLTTLGKVIIMFNLVRFIVFDTVKSLGSIHEDSVSPLPTVLILGDTRIHICFPNCCNIAFYIKASVN